MAHELLSYKFVRALLIDWKESSKESRQQPLKLQEVFEQFYKYPTEHYQFETSNSYNKLDDKIHLFRRDYDHYQTLLIVYYGGQGSIDQDRRAVWKLEDDDAVDAEYEDPSPYVTWWNLQAKFLNQPKADALIILDCCHAGRAIEYATRRRLHPLSPVEPVVEILAATGFESLTPLRGEATYTNNLIEELKRQENWGRKPTGTNVSSIHSCLVHRLKRLPTIFGREQTNNPIHEWLLSNPNPAADERHLKLSRLENILSSEEAAQLPTWRKEPPAVKVDQPDRGAELLLRQIKQSAGD